MVFALNAVMNLAAEIELADGGRFIGDAMPPQRLFSDLVDADALPPVRACR